MIHLSPNTADQEIYLTLYEKRRDLPVFTHYLFKLQHQVSMKEYFFIATFTTDSERYTKVVVSTDADDAVNSSILVTETGRFNYWVYGQNSAANLDPGNTVGEVERGTIQIDGSFTTDTFTNNDNSVVYYGG